MTAFEVGGFFGMAGGMITGALLCKSHGILAVIAGAVGGAVGGLFVGILFGAAMVVLCALASVFWQLITGRLKPDNSNAKRDEKEDAS